MSTSLTASCACFSAVGGGMVMILSAAVRAVIAPLEDEVSMEPRCSCAVPVNGWGETKLRQSQ